MRELLLIADLQEFLNAYRQMLGDPVRENPHLSKAAIEWLKNCSIPRKYSWVTNLKTQSISHCYGVRQSLGYRFFDFQQSFEIIAPSLRSIYESNGKASLIIRAKAELRSKMANANYFQNILVKDIGGKLWQAQQMSTPYRFDQDDCVVEVYNLFHIIGPFDGSPFPMRAHLLHYESHSFPNYFSQEDMEMGAYIRTFLEPEFDIFTPNHWRVMSLLEGGEGNLEVGALWNPNDKKKGYECIKAYNQLILKKAREKFPVFSFEKAREVAALFRDLGMLDD